MYNNKTDKFRNRKTAKPFMETEGKENSGRPIKEAPSSDSYYFQAKSFSDLKYGVIATAADPTTKATTASQPYAIIAKTNQIVAGNYPGQENLAGIVLPQLMISTNSKLINAFDTGNLVSKLNYLFLNLTNKTDPCAVNKFMMFAINEALSRTNAEMTTSLPFAQQQTWVKDTIYTIDPVANPTDPVTGYVLSNNNTIYQLAFYQAFLQNTASVLAKYVQTMSLEDTLINMGFNREANYTVELFSLLKKKSLVGKFHSIATTLYGEYFDQDWFKQINTLTMVPSRKTTSVRDPLLTMTATHVLPDILVRSGASSVKLWQTSDFTYQVQTDTSGSSAVTTQMTMEQLVAYMHKLLDQTNILKWARSRYTNAYEGSSLPDAWSTQKYFNKINWGLEALAALMSNFSAKMSDLRTYLDVMTKIGLNNWTVGTVFNFDRINQVPLVYNKILADLFASYLNSPDTVKFSTDTQRWTMFTLWDEYTGIPDYDQFSGGSFLAFSLRSINANGLAIDDSRMLVPKLFTVEPDSVRLVARSGLEANFNYTSYSKQQLQDDEVYSRLLPLNTMDVTARIPTLELTTLVGTPQVISAAYEAMQTVFNYGMVTVQGQVRTKALDRTSISYLDIQIEDINNKMIVFCRSFAPFKVWTTVSDRQIGFGKR